MTNRSTAAPRPNLLYPPNNYTAPHVDIDEAVEISTLSWNTFQFETSKLAAFSYVKELSTCLHTPQSSSFRVVEVQVRQLAGQAL